MSFRTFDHNMPCAHFPSDILTMSWWSRNRRAMATAQRARMKPNQQHDRATQTSPKGDGEGLQTFSSFGVLAPSLTTTTFISEPECHFSPPTKVILVGPALYLLSCLLIPCSQDEENLRTIVSRLLGELLGLLELHTRSMIR